MLTISEKKIDTKTELETCIEGYLEYSRVIKGICDESVLHTKYELQKFSLYLAQKYGSVTQARLANISSTDIIQYLAKTGTFRAKTTVLSKLSMLKGFFKYAEGMEMIEKDPAKWLKGPRIDRLERLPGFLTPREVELLIHTILAESSKPYSIRDYAIVVLLYSTGIRLSELLALTIESVDLEKRMIKICSTKSRRERFIPLVPLVCEALARHLEVRLIIESDSIALFLNNKRRAISKDNVLRFMRIYSQKAGLKKKVTTRLLRHTCATHLLEYSQQKIETIAKWLGHNHLESTLIYTHISDKEAHKAVQSHPINKILRKYPLVKTRRLRKAV